MKTKASVRQTAVSRLERERMEAPIPVSLGFLGPEGEDLLAVRGRNGDVFLMTPDSRMVAAIIRMNAPGSFAKAL